MATLVLHGIQFEGRHGATVEERRVARVFQVDVEIDAELGAAEHSDRLTDTIDYRELASVIVETGTTGEPSHLLEHLGQRMLDAMAARLPPGTHIRLELRKPHPPGCPGAPAYAAVRLSRP